MNTTFNSNGTTHSDNTRRNIDPSHSAGFVGTLIQITVGAVALAVAYGIIQLLPF